MPIRDLFVRDLGRRIEGVVKVYDLSALAQEIREFVLTDWTEGKLKNILDTFTESLDARRKRGPLMDDMGIWISGFFGSGKSLFAKLIGYLLQNDVTDPETGERAIDLFEQHLHDGPHARDIKRRLAEIRLGASVKTVAFEIKSKQTLNNPNSVAEILLSTFYESLGFSDSIYLARIEKGLQARGRYSEFKADYEKAFGQRWEEGRKEHEFNRARIAKVMARIHPEEYPNEQAAQEGLKDAYKTVKVTAESVAKELVEWVDGQPANGKAGHLIFVIDEMGQFIGDDRGKIEELRALVEQLGNQGKGRIWLIVTSQQALEQVCDRANLQLPLVGKLDARFCVKAGLISDEINKVVGERILKKREGKVAELTALYARHEGYLSQIADLKSTRNLGKLDRDTFAASYPFLPQTIKLAQDIFEALSGFRISGGVRSMITVAQDVAREVADKELGAIASFDMVFNSIEKDLYSQEYLGASGIQAIRESAHMVPGTPEKPPRVLKVLWLLQRIPFVPRTPEVIAKLLVSELGQDISVLRADVEKTLVALQSAGYVAKDEASGEYKYLNEKERTIEQEVQRFIRDMGLGPAVRQGKELLKNKVLTKGKLDQFQIRFGKSQTLFSYNVQLEGEDLTSGNEISVSFIGPLSAKKRERAEIERENRAQGTKGRVIHWIATTPETLEGRLKRYEALRKVIEDERFTRDTAKSTQDALAERRRELSELEESLARDLDRAFREGKVYVSGEERDLDGGQDIKAVLQDAGKTLVGSLYTRFADADKRYDFRGVARLLSPAEKNLHQVEPELDLFDSRGMLQRERPLPALILEAIKDFEDENKATDGSSLGAFFSRIPFGWPSEIVRMTLAAALRGGAVYLEIPSAQGKRELYDYTETGTADLFAKANTFKNVTFRIAQTGLSVEDLKSATKLLARLGITDVPEAGNLIAACVREVGTRLLDAAERAHTYANFGLPIPDHYKNTESVCKAATTVRDPTVAVKDFLARGEEWVVLHQFAASLTTFLHDGREKTFEISRRCLELCSRQPLPSDSPEVKEILKSLEDAEAVVREHGIFEKWAPYHDAYQKGFAAYRKGYQRLYGAAVEAVETLREGLKKAPSYLEAPEVEAKRIMERYFGAGGPLNLPKIEIGSAEGLLSASARHTVSALQALLVGLSGWRSTIEAELSNSRKTPPPPEPTPQKTYEWRPLVELGGRRFSPGESRELEEQLDQLKEKLKRKLGEGFTVVVK